MKKIRDRFDMRDYLNMSDLTNTNAKIAEFILENTGVIRKKSLNTLSNMSYFSEPTLSRFFKNVCGLSYDEYLESDIIRKYEYQKIIISDWRTDLYMNQMMSLRENVSVEDEILIKIADGLYQSKRIIFVGPASLQGYSHSLSTVMLCNDKASFAPYNYTTQQSLIENLCCEDMIFIHSLSDNWWDTDLPGSYQVLLKQSGARKTVICKNAEKFKEVLQCNIIELGNISKILEDIQLLSVYKILALKYFEKYGFHSDAM